MESIKCEKMDIVGQIEPTSRSSISIEKVIETIPKEYPQIKTEPETQDEFNSLMNAIKYEEETGQFETIFITPMILSENNVDQNSEQNSEFSKVLLKSSNDRQNLCRLCATPCNDMIHMFDQNELYKNVIKKIDCCLPIMVRENDTLPKQACRTCLEKLELCYQFHSSVAEAEKQLLILEDEQKSGESNCPISPLFNNEESQFGQKYCYSALNSPASPVHSEKELESNVNLSDFETDIPLVTINNQASNSLSKKAEEDSRDDDNNIHINKEESNSENIVTNSGNKLKNKFATQLKQKFLKLYHKSDIGPHAVRKPVSLIEPRTEENLSGNPEEKIIAIECPFCRKRFHSGVLHVHKEICCKRLATEEKTVYSCSHCDKKFYRKAHLEAHVHTHSRERPWSCTLCGQAFRTRRTKNDHVKLHRGERLFTCHICGKVFKKACGLRGHARYHSYKIHCPLCDKVFNTETRRNRHMEVHAGAKPCQ